MQSLKVFDEQGVPRWLLFDRDGVAVEIVGRFLRFLQYRLLSPNTVAAYARDLTLFFLSSVTGVSGTTRSAGAGGGVP